MRDLDVLRRRIEDAEAKRPELAEAQWRRQFADNQARIICSPNWQDRYGHATVPRGELLARTLAAYLSPDEFDAVSQYGDEDFAAIERFLQPRPTNNAPIDPNPRR